MNNQIRIVIYSLAIVLLASCATSNPVPQNNFYRLTELQPTKIKQNSQLPGVLLVERVKAFGILRERPLLYSFEKSPEAVKQHHYHHWVDAPTSLIREQISTYLRRANIAADIVTETRNQQPNYRLRAELKQFERRLLDNGEVEILVVLRIEVISKDNTQSKNYAIKRRHQSNSVLASVREINSALAEIYTAMVENIILTS
ncbi:MAG: hypothetical protein GY763_01315 [Gammaproteobacteria bacterium]|nr:hypothetical protein [Gammaproteobacteria bacterium]